MEYRYIDFSPYYNPEDVKDYELFIGPNGEYYKVKTIYESDQNCTHYEWATGYFRYKNIEDLKENKLINNKCKTEIDILINYFGFVRYTHCGYRSYPIFSLPNKDYYGYIMTRQQKESIYKILYYNKEKIDEKLVESLETETIIYEEKIEKTFRKILTGN